MRLISTMRRTLAAGLALALAACSHLGPTSIDIDRGRLEQAVAARFPYETRWLGLLDVRVGAPALRLLPATDRIATEVALNVDERYSGKQLSGSIAFESGLRYEPADATLRLARVQVDGLSLGGLPDVFSGQTARLGALLAEQLLEGAELYRLNEAQRASLRAQGVQPGDIHVTAQGLRVDLVPAPP